MFLSYTQESRTSNFENRKLERRNSSNSSTPHLFLPYAGRESAGGFEKRCISLMQGEPLSEMQMISVAKAMSKASDDTAKGKRSSTKLRHSLHASIFKKLLSSEHESLVEVGNDGTPDLLLEPEDSSTWETEFLRDQVKRQHEELRFLRLALRHLISSIGADQPIQRTEKESRNPVNAVQVPAVQDRDLLGQLPATTKLPSIIEIPIDNSDDHSEQMSELQSPSVIVLRNLSKKLKEIGTNAPVVEIQPEPTPAVVSGYALHNKLAVLQKSAPPRRPSYPMCIPASVIDLTNNEECKEETDRVEESMQLVVASKAERDQRAYTFTDMVKGEVQEGRARGLKYRLHFERRGVFVEGLYSGTVRGGLPHGTGVLRFDNRDLYIGQFSEGKMHGEGSLLSRSESKLCTFRGIFKDNEFVEPVATAKRISGSMVSVDVR